MTIEIQPTLGLKDAIQQRRAARAFHRDPIPPAILEAILRLGVRSPSGYNLQPWRFIVVRDRDNREKLKACAFDQRQVGEAPMVLICCGDRRVNDPDYIESVIQLGQETDAINEQYAQMMREAVPQLFDRRPYA
jgi:nitroreductase